jgi:PGF-pre-PGF domain-containing protein
MLLQFKKPTSKEYRNSLKELGVEYISYIPENAWIAKISGNKGQIISEKKVHAVLPYKPLFRIDPQLKKQVKEKTGEVQVRVQFFKSTENPEEILSPHGELNGKFSEDIWKLNTSRQNISEIAGEKHVKWISDEPPGYRTNNDKSRELIDVNRLQEPSYNLRGQDFTAGIWDGGEVGEHQDLNFSGKLFLGETSTVNEHATHVAGTMAGAGRLQKEYRGMAPNSSVVSYDFNFESLTEFYSETDESINQHDSILSQNSWGWKIGGSNGADPETMGNYEGYSHYYDEVIANESSEVDGTFPVIFSAGNEGDRTPRYNTTTGPGGTAKNTITVGAVGDAAEMTYYSSWGPTDDNRIKPTVVADGGCGDNSAIKSTVPGNSYDIKCGTSMSSPAVSGAAILLNQQFNRTYGDLPAPATVKAAFIHTAEDLGRKGPDYKFGWGLVNATEAINYVKESDEKDLIKRDIIQKTNDSESYIVTVPEGESVKFTLVWSDYPASSTADKTLVNDLDLVVKNGNNERQYPWTINWSDRTDPAERNMEDHTNPVEQVYVGETNTTEYNVTVHGNDVPKSSQDYTLMMTSNKVDTVAPNVSVESPENTTYSSVPDFNLSSNESLVDARFSIDGGKNYSMQEKNLTYFYNTSAVVNDGFHEAVFWGNDSSGNYGSDSVFFTLDTSDPSLTPLAPAADANLSSGFDVNATWSDSGTGVEKHNFTVSNSSYSEDGVLNGSVNLDEIADGEYTIFYNVTDGVGNENIKSRSVSLDTKAPEIEIRWPENNTVLNEGFETDAVFNDSVTGIDNINISLDNSSGVLESSSENLSIDPASYADGYYNISFRANDSAGNVMEKFLNVSFDNSPPELVITSPSANNSEVSTPFDVNATWSDFSDTGTGRFEVSNESGIQVSGELNSTVKDSDIGRGNYNISYEVSDEAGNTVNKTYTVSVNIPPGIEIHSPDSRVYAETPVFNMSSGDSLEEAFVEVNGSNRSLTGSGDYFVNDSVHLPSGGFDAVFYGNDTEGVLGKNSVEFTVDQEAPRIEILSPVEDANVSGDFSAEASVEDLLLDVNSSSYQLFNSSGNQTGEKDLNSTLDISELVDGSYNITFTANDSVGNLKEVNRSFTLDTENPSLQVFRPEEDLVRDEFSVNFTSNDSGTGLENSSFRLVNSSGDTILWNSSNRTLDSSGFEDRDYTLVFNATDYAGNYNYIERGIEFDNTDPSIEIVSPSEENLSDESGDPNVEVLVNDSNFDSALFRWEKDGENMTSWMQANQSFDISELEDGKRELFVKANDTAGNENAVSKEFTVDNTKPQIELTKYGYEELDNGWKKSSYTVEAECTDSGTGVKELTADPSTGSSNSTTNSTTLNATVSGSGVQGVDFTCLDFAGNEKTAGDTSQVDSGPPAVESTNPSNGSEDVDRSFELDASLHDETDESGVNSSASFIEISEGELENVNWTNESFTADISDLGYSESFELTGNITDYAGLTYQVDLEYNTVSDPDSGSSGGGSSGGGGGGGGGGGFSMTSDEDSGSEQSEKEPPEMDVEESESSVRVSYLNLDESWQDVDLSDMKTAFRSVNVTGSGVANFSAESVDKDPTPPNNTEVYNTLEMDVSGTEEVSAKATFLVSRKWLESNNLRPEKTSLYRKSGSGWEELPTVIEEVGSNAFKYQAEIPDFSTFTIATEREKCLKKNYSLVKDGECRSFYKCDAPEGELVDSCRSYREENPVNSTGNTTSLMAKMQVPEADISNIKLEIEDIKPVLILLVVLAFISIAGYFAYQWYEKYQLQETLEDIKEVSGKDPELIYNIDIIEQAIQEGDYEKAADKMKDIKEMITPEEND